TLYYDVDELNTIEARLNEINHLKKKYGLEIADIFAYKDKIEQELEELQFKDDHLLKLEEEMNQVKKEAKKVATKLHETRKEAASFLEKEIETELQDLYLENAQFVVHFEEQSSSYLDENGMDIVSFKVSTNIGEPLNALAKVASGGELSRIMLALKNIFSTHDQIHTVIFDE